ncbi:MAG: ral secretion pathway protein [Candidatus Dependentiae bacterium]|nr:ral secretion pathway protein [Candidatus Dependentiae bacterium]
MNKKFIFTIALIVCVQAYPQKMFDDFLSAQTPSLENRFDDDVLAATPSLSLGNESALTKEAQRNPDLFGPVDEKKDVYLNFENADLKNFVEYIADIKGMNIIPDKSIAGNKISLNFRNPVSKTGAWNTFLTVLEMANLSIVKVGNLYRVITKDKKFKLPLPTFIGVNPNTLPDSDATIRYIAMLDNIPAQDVKNLLQSMLSQPTSLLDPPNINGFIITDCSCVIKAAMQVLNELDQTGVEESVYVIPLKKANASDVKTLFETLITTKDSNPLAKLLGKPQDSSEYFTPGTRIIAEDRTNKLILLGQRQSLEKIKNFITEHIDTDLKQAKSPLRIYDLQNANVTDIVTILKSATDSSQSSAAGKQAATFGAIRDGAKYFKNMTFQADKEGNRLLVSCTEDGDWDLLKETIKKLDTAQPQVAMQMLIVSISATALTQLGGQFRSPNQNSVGGGINFQTAAVSQPVFTTDSSGNTQSVLGNMLNSLALGRGMTAVSLGNAGGSNGVWGVFNAIKQQTDATILSQPFAVAANCTETKLLVGSTSYITTQSTGGAGAISGKTPADANTTITFTPQVNSEGVIRLKITADIKEFVPESANLSTQSKYLDTVVTVANGQVLVIGGFIQTKITDNGGQTPLLGSIPILGWIAKNLSRTVEKSYLFLFLCPTILKPRTSPGIGTYSKMCLHQAAKEVEETIKTTKTNDPIHNWLFNSSGENYSHKVIDFANARYQPNTVDIRYDPYYRSSMADTGKQAPPLKIDGESSSPGAYMQTQHMYSDEAKIQEKSTKVVGEKVAKEVEMPQQPLENKPLKKKESRKKPEKVIFDPQREVIRDDNDVIAAIEAPLPAPTTAGHLAPEPANIAMFDVDTALAEKRSRLRSLLAQGSLGDLLTKPATQSSPIKEMTEEEFNASYEIEPEIETVPESTPVAQDSFTLTRRNGIQNLFATSNQGEVNTSSLNRPASSGLQSLFGGK